VILSFFEFRLYSLLLLDLQRISKIDFTGICTSAKFHIAPAQGTSPWEERPEFFIPLSGPRLRTPQPIFAIIYSSSVGKTRTVTRPASGEIIKAFLALRISFK
jgi:hypothetical protein